MTLWTLCFYTLEQITLTKQWEFFPCRRGERPIQHIPENLLSGCQSPMKVGKGNQVLLHLPVSITHCTSKEQPVKRGYTNRYFFRGGGRGLSSEFWDPKAMDVFFAKLVPVSHLPVLTILNFFRCHNSIHLHACAYVQFYSYSLSTWFHWVLSALEESLPHIGYNTLTGAKGLFRKWPSL